MNAARTRLWTGGAGRHEGGFVATELAMGVGLLLLPVTLLVLTLPTWSERQTTARAIAREVARTIARDGMCDVEAGMELSRTMARNLGVDFRDLDIDARCVPTMPLPSGDDVEVDVTVRMPAVRIPAIGKLGEWQWTARHREPVDAYRSTP